MLRDTPPSCAFTLKLIGRSTIDVEHTRNGELQVVKVSSHHSPEVVLSRGIRLTHLRNRFQHFARRFITEVTSKTIIDCAPPLGFISQMVVRTCTEEGLT